MSTNVESVIIVKCYNCGLKIELTTQTIIADVEGKKDAPFCYWGCLYETMKEGT